MLAHVMKINHPAFPRVYSILLGAINEPFEPQIS